MDRVIDSQSESDQATEAYDAVPGHSRPVGLITRSMGGIAPTVSYDTAGLRQLCIPRSGSFWGWVVGCFSGGAAVRVVPACRGPRPLGLPDGRRSSR